MYLQLMTLIQHTFHQNPKKIKDKIVYKILFLTKLKEKLKKKD